MTEIESKDIRTRQKQLFNHFFGGRRRSECRHLFGRFAPSLGHTGRSGYRGGQARRADGATVRVLGRDGLKEMRRRGGGACGGGPRGGWMLKGARRRPKGRRDGREGRNSKDKLHGDGSNQSSLLWGRQKTNEPTMIQQVSLVPFRNCNENGIFSEQRM